ncbi:MAG: YerC/YecD family TrpR-related protein [Acutalibacteraceae bacterium]|nr:YerC/YecD family TrpR-related protein [Acutalibacteraceae bacterium]
MMVDIKNEMTDSLFKAILTLETVEECYKFFEDVCTVKEIKAIAQRLEVARMLKNKQLYSKIVTDTGASTATISRVNRSLMYGSEGYDIVFDRLEEKDK